MRIVSHKNSVPQVSPKRLRLRSPAAGLLFFNGQQEEIVGKAVQIYRGRPGIYFPKSDLAYPRFGAGKVYNGFGFGPPRQDELTPRLLSGGKRRHQGSKTSGFFLKFALKIHAGRVGGSF